MSRSILVIGESGAGKTTSLRTLDPATTFIFNSDKKSLPWRGWKKNYSVESKNYFATSSVNQIAKVLERINAGDLKHIRVAVIDTLNGIMVDDEMSRMREKNFDKWVDLASSIYELISRANDMRDDLTVICTAHTETDEDGFIRMKTSGRKLRKIVPESKFTTVLLAKGSEGHYLFETRANHSTAKTPMGCFDAPEIENDMAAVIKTLDAYERGE